MTTRDEAARLADALEPLSAYGRVGTRDVDQAALQQVCAALRAALAQPAAPAVPERWVIVRETVLDVGQGTDVRSGGAPEIGYALLSHAVTFPSEDAARTAHRSADLPLGWVIMPLSRLLPDLSAAPAVREPATADQIKALVGASDEYWATSKLLIAAIFRCAEDHHGITGAGNG